MSVAKEKSRWIAFDTSDPMVQQLLSDDTYRHFLSQSFDSKTISPMHGMTINEQIIKITNGIDILNKCMHSLVCDKYEDLLAQSTKMDTLEEVLKGIQTRIEGLLTGVHRIRAKLLSPYGRICEQIVVLNRLQTTCDLLRRTIRVIHLSKRLSETRLDETEPTLVARQMTKAGQYIHQIESICAEDTNDCLIKVQVIRNDLKAVVGVRTALVEKADQLLESGLTQQDTNQMSAALQVFFSLQMLDQKVRHITNEKQEWVCKAINDAIDVSVLGQSKTSGPGRVVIPMTIAQNSSIRSTLRQNIETLIEKIFSAFSQMSQIYRIVSKKRDSLTNSCLIEQMQSTDTDGLHQFFTHVTTSLSEQLCKVANDSMLVRQALETEYPNYLKSFSQLWNRISRDHNSIPAEKVLRSSMQAFESAYLSRSLSLLFDSVNKVFADAKETALMADSLSNATNVPSVEDIDSIVRHIASELHVSSGDTTLCLSVAKNVTKTVNLFVVKCEQLSSVDGHSTQVIGPLTYSQRLNATIVDRLNTFRLKVNNLLVTSNCPIDCLKLVEQSLNCIENLMTNTINPIISSVMDAIEAILLTMHSENYSEETDLSASDVRASEYMKELQGFIARVCNDYFRQYPDCDVTHNCIDRVADRTIRLFLTQVTLIRPLSQSGRMRVAADFAQLEMALTPLCQPIGRLGKTYRILRSFKPLLFQSPELIVKSGAVGHLIPYSLILQFLISGFAPNDIKNAHQYMNWSHSRYTKWLDLHPDEQERLALIKNSLESYVKHIRQSQGKAFASVYPILVEVLQKALQKTNYDNNE